MKELSRDYINTPLKHGEKPSKEDFKYLYIDLNLTSSEVAKILNVSRDKILYCAKLFSLHKTKEQIKESRKQFWKNSSEEYKKNRSENIKKAFTNMSIEKKNKMRNNLKNTLAKETKEQKEKRIKAFKKTWYNRTEEEKKVRSKKLSDAHHSLTEEQLKIKVEKFRKSFSETWSKKSEKEKRFYIEQMQETKRRKGNLNTSKQEDKVFDLLNSKYPNQVIRQYKTEEYPFYCDFYLPFKNLYIEANFSWTHGPHAFDNSSIEDLKILEEWKIKSKNSKFFQAAIETWTKRGPLKLSFVKQNNLNFICFYSYKEFIKWFESLST